MRPKNRPVGNTVFRRTFVSKEGNFLTTQYKLISTLYAAMKAPSLIKVPLFWRYPSSCSQWVWCMYTVQLWGKNPPKWSWKENQGRHLIRWNGAPAQMWFVSCFLSYFCAGGQEWPMLVSVRWVMIHRWASLVRYIVKRVDIIWNWVILLALICNYASFAHRQTTRHTESRQKKMLTERQTDR